jgi:hypothetical protein
MSTLGTAAGWKMVAGEAAEHTSKLAVEVASKH